ncbi:sigma-70 family RNA polymerase sigma factor [bacterium]|nr:sigma-70 family RNA polymerase sigma factor [bacterium]
MKEHENDLKILMRLSQEGDAEAFGKLYELYFSPIFRYIRFRVKNKEEADDLTQTVFLKVFRSLPRFQDQNKPPHAYFFAVAKNTVIDYWRSKKPVHLKDAGDTFLEIPDSGSSPIEQAEKKEAGEALRRALMTLTEEQQEVVILKFINGMDNKEIAALLGKKEEAIRQLQCRAFKTLRSILKNVV